MRYVKMPNTALEISAIALGSVGIGGPLSTEESFVLLDRFHELGGTLLDTAEIYSAWLPNGERSSEICLGKWMKERNNRHEMRLSTKGAHPRLDSMHIPRLDKASIMTDLEGSLTCLQTDYIDIYWMHRDDVNRPVADILATLEQAKTEGKILAYGCSNWTLPRMKEAEAIAQKSGGGFVCNQPMWSFAKPNPGSIGDPTLVPMDQETFEWHKSVQWTVIPYTSQAGGFFSGKYRPDTAEADTAEANTAEANITGTDGKLKGMMRTYYSDLNFSRLTKAEQLAAELGCTATQIALAWLMNQKIPVVPIIGSHTIEQINDSCGAANVRLTEQQVAFLGTMDE